MTMKMAEMHQLSFCESIIAKYFVCCDCDTTSVEKIFEL